MGCINETIASSWLEASLKDATAPIARAAIRELIADDVHHSRLGWAHLASARVTFEVRSQVAAWLPRLFDTAARPWLETEHRYGNGVPAHGVPSDATTREAVVRALGEVILPGFDVLGVATGPARAWAVEHGVETQSFVTPQRPIDAPKLSLAPRRKYIVPTNGRTR
jgi:hypothetical protein